MLKLLMSMVCGWVWGDYLMYILFNKLTLLVIFIMQNVCRLYYQGVDGITYNLFIDTSFYQVSQILIACVLYDGL